jgi:hypothetical protein
LERDVHLLSAKDQALLHGWNTLFLLDALLDLGYFVVGLDVQLNFFAGEGADSVRFSVSIFV